MFCLFYKIRYLHILCLLSIGNRPGAGLVYMESTQYILGWKSISLIVFGVLAITGAIFGPIIHYNKYYLGPDNGVHFK